MPWRNERGSTCRNKKSDFDPVVRLSLKECASVLISYTHRQSVSRLRKKLVSNQASKQENIYKV